jgi:hypothetical protein
MPPHRERSIACHSAQPPRLRRWRCQRAARPRTYRRSRAGCRSSGDRPWDLFLRTSARPQSCLRWRRIVRSRTRPSANPAAVSGVPQAVHQRTDVRTLMSPPWTAAATSAPEPTPPCAAWCAAMRDEPRYCAPVLVQQKCPPIQRVRPPWPRRSRQLEPSPSLLLALLEIVGVHQHRS